MKENLDIALDEKRDLDDRLQALDNFEMLIEHIDNANDLEKLKMWEPLHRLLTADTSEDEIKRLVLWIIGTAVQNNPSAQTSYLALSPIPALLSFLSPSITSAKTRSKAVYALSGLLKHNAAAVKQLHENEGWEAIKRALEDSDITVRRKAAFLLNTLLIPTASTDSQPSRPSQPTQPGAPTASNAPPSNNTSITIHPTAESTSSNGPVQTTNVVHPNSHASMLSDPSFFTTSDETRKALEERGILKALIDGLVSPVPHGPDGEAEGDADFEEKVISILHTYLVALKGSPSPSEKQTLSKFVGEQTKKVGGDAKLAEKWGLTPSEFAAFRSTLA
ncbi:Fes1-domain-containing protein [Panus rudis PR-1116 ss-1]|nr:Fes1-domain-containing protein [Panus rudis PR-1116 ss-1]